MRGCKSTKPELWTNLDEHIMLFDATVGNYAFNYIEDDEIKTDTIILP